MPDVRQKSFFLLTVVAYSKGNNSKMELQEP